MLEDSESFAVTRIALSRGGLFYVMRGAKFLMMDAENRFQGLVGSTRVNYSLAFAMVRLFASQEQLEYFVTPEPPAYSAFTLGEDGLLYATVEDSANQIQIINGNGDNIYVGQFRVPAVFYDINRFGLFFQGYVPPFNRFLLGQKRLIRRAAAADRAAGLPLF